ncbi:peptidase inhibitor family I36 protein [Amycolatopsis nigrescens]|uniref:peptidase inhibitor family I36 protein n=1 Tax=Amycolatopsis nigrescens TaxID=381445 RepID=UPI000372B487|nr:peptidase inhibitor family I36 protein [Amycolatopsis nigrescens]
MNNENRPRRGLITLLAGVAAGLALLTGAGVANAENTPAQDQIDHIVAGQPDAIQTSPTTVTWRDSGVSLTADAAGPEQCGFNQFCLWEHSDFKGWMVSFNESSCAYVIELPSFGFNDVASSWVNNTARRVEVWEHSGAYGLRLWTEIPYTASRWVGEDAQDRASSLVCR